MNGHPPWAPDFTTLGSTNPYSSNPSSQQQPCSRPASNSESEANDYSPAAGQQASQKAPSSASITAFHQPPLPVHNVDPYSGAALNGHQHHAFGAPLAPIDALMIDKSTNLIKNSEYQLCCGLNQAASQ